MSTNQSWGGRFAEGPREAVAAYTEGGAYGMCAEDQRGRLAVGMQADVILVAGDLAGLATDPQAARVTHTFRDGALIFAA